MKMQVIEPSVIRLTSDETRALMKIALAPQPITVDHGGRGIIDLGLVEEVPSKVDPLEKTKRDIAMLTRRAFAEKRSVFKVIAYGEEIKRLTNLLKYGAPQKQKLYRLTLAGQALVKGVTIRRR